MHKLDLRIFLEALMEYDNLESAQEAAAYVLETHGSRVIPYHCSDCGMWHLSPRSRQTKTVSSTRDCQCTGSDGCPKDAYASKKDATNRAAIIQSEEGVQLRVYKCECGDYWHLTKSAEHENYDQGSDESSNGSDGSDESDADEIYEY